MRIFTSSKRSTFEPPPKPPFNKIEDADFEDITPEPKPPEPKQEH
jgi:hypothetical protein